MPVINYLVRKDKRWIVQLPSMPPSLDVFKLRGVMTFPELSTQEGYYPVQLEQYEICSLELLLLACKQDWDEVSIASAYTRRIWKHCGGATAGWIMETEDFIQVLIRSGYTIITD